MFPGDSRERWPSDLLTDARVVHYWDEQRSIGRLYFLNLPRMWDKRVGQVVPSDDLILWDAYLLYPADAVWGEQSPETISWGATILATRDRLKLDLAETLKNLPPESK